MAIYDADTGEEFKIVREVIQRDPDGTVLAQWTADEWDRMQVAMRGSNREEATRLYAVGVDRVSQSG